MKASITNGGVTFEVEADTADGLRDQLADLAAASPTLFEKAFAVRAAGYAKDDSSGKVPPRPAKSDPGEPGSRGKSAPPAAKDVPNCDCGVPMNDVRGKTYQRGEKKGEPYPYDFYPACDNKKGDDRCQAVKI